MKKIFCLLLALVLSLTALTACNKGNTQTDTTTESTTASDTTTEPVSSTEPTTEIQTEATTKKPEDPEVVLINQFLKYLKDKNISKIVEFIGAGNYDKAEEAKIEQAYSFFKNFDIKTYKILDQYNNYWFEVELTITKSSDSRFPIGTSRWIVEINTESEISGNIALFRRANKALHRITWQEQSDVVEFCDSFSLAFGYETVDDFNKIVPKDEPNFDYFCDGLIRFTKSCSNGNIVKRTLLESRAKEMLGITGINFKKSSQYIKATDSISTDFLGAAWHYSSLASEDFDPVSKRYTVVIDFYSDLAFILKAKTVRYIVQEHKNDSLTLLSTELLFDSGLYVLSGAD